MDTSATPLDQPAPQDATAPAADDMSQGFTIEISCLPDGTFQISTEPLAAEAAEETGTPGSEMGQPLQSIGEVLKKVMSIVQNNGATDDGDAAFDEGYKGPATQTDTALRA